MDLDAVRSAKTIRTEELWTIDQSLVVYHPHCSYKKNKNGGHELKLTYLSEEHPEDLRDKILWGTSLLTIDRTLKEATALWTTVPTDLSSDGQAEVKVSLDRPGSNRSQELIKRAKRAQQVFKRELLKRASACELLGERLDELLEAAHIQDVGDGGPDTPENGIILRSDLHRLLDAGLIAFKPDGGLRLSPRLSSHYKDLLKGKQLSCETIDRIQAFLPKRRKRPTELGEG